MDRACRAILSIGRDFKVIVEIEASKFPAWEKAEFAPEGDLLCTCKLVKGVTDIETQSYTIQRL